MTRESCRGAACRESHQRRGPAPRAARNASRQCASARPIASASRTSTWAYSTVAPVRLEHRQVLADLALTLDGLIRPFELCGSQPRDPSRSRSRALIVAGSWTPIESAEFLRSRSGARAEDQQSRPPATCQIRRHRGRDSTSPTRDQDRSTFLEMDSSAPGCVELDLARFQHNPPTVQVSDLRAFVVGQKLIDEERREVLARVSAVEIHHPSATSDHSRARVLTSPAIPP